jgi:DNA-binding beta-propeller fold protein YncE
MQTIGEHGSSPGSFLSPASLALSPYGTIYIADMNNHRVQVFNTDGMFMTEFGVGRLKHPLSIIITADSHVLVTDYGSNCIFVFDLMGELLDCFKVPGTPYGMAIDSSGSLIVALRNSRQVVVY